MSKDLGILETDTSCRESLLTHALICFPNMSELIITRNVFYRASTSPQPRPTELEFLGADTA